MKWLNYEEMHEIYTCVVGFSRKSQAQSIIRLYKHTHALSAPYGLVGSSFATTPTNPPCNYKSSVRAFLWTKKYSQVSTDKSHVYEEVTIGLASCFKSG